MLYLLLVAYVTVMKDAMLFICAAQISVLLSVTVSIVDDSTINVTVIVMSATTCAIAGLLPGNCSWQSSPDCFTGTCYCDSACCKQKDCCPDAETQCGMRKKLY